MCIRVKLTGLRQGPSCYVLPYASSSRHAAQSSGRKFDARRNKNDISYTVMRSHLA